MAQIRLNVGLYAQSVRSGRVSGTNPQQAISVKCDNETTTQNDIDRGVVNIVFGLRR